MDGEPTNADLARDLRAWAAVIEARAAACKAPALRLAELDQAADLRLAADRLDELRERVRVLELFSEGAKP